MIGTQYHIEKDFGLRWVLKKKNSVLYMKKGNVIHRDSTHHIKNPQAPLNLLHDTKIIL